MDRGTTPYSDTNNLLIVGSTIAGVLVLVIILAWLRTWFFESRNEVLEEQVLSVENPALEKLNRETENRLSTYGWVNREKGIVHIPIDRAMTLLVEEGASRPPGEEGP